MNKIQNKVVNGNWGDNGNNHVINTLQQPMDPAVTTKQLLALGEDPVWDT